MAQVGVARLGPPLLLSPSDLCRGSSAGDGLDPLDARDKPKHDKLSNRNASATSSTVTLGLVPRVQGKRRSVCFGWRAGTTILTVSRPARRRGASLPLPVQTPRTPGPWPQHALPLLIGVVECDPQASLHLLFKGGWIRAILKENKSCLITIRMQLTLIPIDEKSQHVHYLSADYTNGSRLGPYTASSTTTRSCGSTRWPVWATTSATLPSISA